MIMELALPAFPVSLPALHAIILTTALHALPTDTSPLPRPVYVSKEPLNLTARPVTTPV